MPTEVSNLLEGNPWLLLIFGAAIAFRFIGGVLAEASESWAKVLAPVGGHRWRDRAERKKASRRSSKAQDYADMETQIARLSKRVTALATAMEVQEDYLIYDTEYHTTLEVQMVQNGYIMPPPRHIGWLEYKRQHTIPDVGGGVK